MYVDQAGLIVSLVPTGAGHVRGTGRQDLPYRLHDGRERTAGRSRPVQEEGAIILLLLLLLLLILLLLLLLLLAAAQTGGLSRLSRTARRHNRCSRSIFILLCVCVCLEKL